MDIKAKHKNILIDCDPGIDDALALFLALGESAFRIKAVTTESGNVGINQTTKNLISILQLVDMKAFPKIGKGSARSLKGKILEARTVHGNDGLANSYLDLPEPDLEIQDGIGLIVSEITSKYIDTLIATGPLTNIAKAMQAQPGIQKDLKSLYIMGGALAVPGNVTKFAEFNFACDPEAADIVLDSKIPVTLVSLDVTQKAILREDDLRRFKKLDNRLSGFIQHVAGYSIDFHRRIRGVEGAYIHDPLTVGIAIDEGLAEFEDLCLGVELSGEERGRLVIKKGSPNTRFVRRVDYKKFMELFLGNLEKLVKEVK